MGLGDDLTLTLYLAQVDVLKVRKEGVTGKLSTEKAAAARSPPNSPRHRNRYWPSSLPRRA